VKRYALTLALCLFASTSEAWPNQSGGAAGVASAGSAQVTADAAQVSADTALSYTYHSATFKADDYASGLCMRSFVMGAPAECPDMIANGQHTAAIFARTKQEARVTCVGQSYRNPARATLFVSNGLRSGTVGNVSTDIGEGHGLYGTAWVPISEGVQNGATMYGLKLSAPGRNPTGMLASCLVELR